MLPGFCPEIGHILNGQVVHVTPKVGQAAVRFHCNKTHRLIGKPRLECINGRWNGALPFCESALEIGERKVYYQSQLPNRFHAKELIKFTLRFLSCW